VAGWLLTLGALLALVGVGLVVLRPAVVLIRQQFDDVRTSEDRYRRLSDKLEVRVHDRTGQLSEANQILRTQISERVVAEERSRELFEQLTHVTRLHTIGEMAAELAHEINQPLGAIANYAEGCLVLWDAGRSGTGEFHGALERISAAALRAGEITRRICRFGRAPAEPHALVDVNDLIVEIADLCGPDARRSAADIQLDLTRDLPLILADPIQIQQVLANLIRNGLQAACDRDGGDRWVRVSTGVSSSNEIEVRVTDNGPGLPSLNREQVFQPFFTTRSDGLGMGLAISRSIVESHGGRLWATDAAGGGAEFRFTLTRGASRAA
jgi:C4-dicarboxylate-specific signal transduction histidine kinase